MSQTAAAASPRSRFVIGGRINVAIRMTRDQRDEAAKRAADQGISMSEWCLRAIEIALKRKVAP